MEIRVSPFLQTNHIPSSGRQFFQLYQRFFKVEAAFSYSGNIFFNILHPVSANGFYAQWEHYFSVSANSLLAETIFGIRRNQFLEKELIQWTIDFLGSGNHFFLYFSETLTSDFFRLVAAFFSTKSFIPTRGNGFAS